MYKQAFRKDNMEVFFKDFHTNKTMPHFHYYQDTRFDLFSIYISDIIQKINVRWVIILEWNMLAYLSYVKIASQVWIQAR